MRAHGNLTSRPWNTHNIRTERTAVGSSTFSTANQTKVAAGISYKVKRYTSVTDSETVVHRTRRNDCICVWALQTGQCSVSNFCSHRQLICFQKWNIIDRKVVFEKQVWLKSKCLIDYRHWYSLIQSLDGLIFFRYQVFPKELRMPKEMPSEKELWNIWCWRDFGIQWDGLKLL